MIVIIEGPDGTGKTTLAKELESRGMIYHNKRRSENYTTDEMASMLYDDNIHVLDRSFLTEWAYRLLRNEPPDKTDFSFSRIYEFLTSGALKIIYCNYPYGYSKAMERGEDNIVDVNEWNNLQKIYNFIIDTILLYKLCPVYFYTWSMDTIENVIDYIGGINAIRQLHNS